MLKLAIVAFIAGAAVPSFAAPVTPVTPSPYTATYAVSYRGVSAGLLHFDLRSEGEGKFVYETRAEPGVLASFFVGDNAVERSVMQIDAKGVRPISWFLEDGKSGDDRDGALEFAWDEKRVYGKVEGERVSLPTEPGLQERLSFQIAVLTALLRGRDPGTIPVIDKDRIKRYSYTRAGTKRVKTIAGVFETVLYESTRPGSIRLKRIWHAPALDYIPVRAEMTRAGRVETVMELVRVKLGEGGQ